MRIFSYSLIIITPIENSNFTVYADNKTKGPEQTGLSPWQWLAFSPPRSRVRIPWRGFSVWRLWRIRLLVLSCDELATNQGCTPALVDDGGLQKGPQWLNLSLFYHQEPGANDRKEKLDRVHTSRKRNSYFSPIICIQVNVVFALLNLLFLILSLFEESFFQNHLTNLINLLTLGLELHVHPPG